MSQYPENLDTFTTKTDNVDYVIADHVNFLQDVINAVQITLGLNPHGVAVDVGDRIGDVEDDLDTHKGSEDHDSRYGGTGWSDTQTLVGHTHSGTGGTPSKINLSNQVTGQLKRQDIVLTHNATGALTAHNIAMSETNSDSIRSTISSIDTALGTHEGKVGTSGAIGHMKVDGSTITVDGSGEISLAETYITSNDFGDHSERHEKDGWDEINLEDLNGESAALKTHKDNHNDPHIYEDISSDPNWTGVKYKLVVEEGQAYMEVVES